MTIVNDKIKGGLADNMTLVQIAQKHDVTLEQIKKQLAKGIKVEFEHTDDVQKATEIAKDHLVELPDYYDRLEEMENKYNSHWKETEHPRNEDGKFTDDLSGEQKKFNDEIDKIKSGKYPRGKQITVTENPSKPWLNAGLQNKKMVLPVAVFLKSTQEKHNVDEETIRNFPELLLDPPFIFKSSTQVNSFIGVLDATENDGDSKKPLIVAIKPINDVVEVNIITSAYGKDENFINREIEKGNLLYKRKKTILNSIVASFATESLKSPNNIITNYAVDYNPKTINIKEHEGMSTQKTNAKDWAKNYRAKFIEKGVCTYEDEVVYLSQETLNKAIQTIKGRPTIIIHKNVTPDNMEDHAVGYVTDVDFDECSADFWCNFIVFDDEAKQLIANGYSVSCAYIPKAYGDSGTWHNTHYDREITDLEFTHLALVPDPRYEDAKIYENSKTGGKKIMFKLFKTQKEEISNENAVVELTNGVTIPVADLIQEYQNSKKKAEVVKLNAMDEVEVDGKKVKISELLTSYKNAMKKNADDGAKKKDEELDNEDDEDEEELDNEDDEDEDEEKKEKGKEEFNKMKKNSKTAGGGASPYRYWSDQKGSEDAKNMFSINK